MSIFDLFRKKKCDPEQYKAANAFFIAMVPKLIDAFQKGKRTVVELQDERFYRMLLQHVYGDKIKPILREIHTASSEMPNDVTRMFIHLDIPSSGEYGEAKEIVIILNDKAKTGKFYLMEYSPNEGYAVCSYASDMTHFYYGMVKTTSEFITKVYKLAV
jgi:hypothetical protein